VKREMNTVTTAPIPDGASPEREHVDRLYWSALGASRVMPGMGLAALRYGWRQNRPQRSHAIEQTRDPVSPHISDHGTPPS
jgi:hypothetical protein